VSGKSTPLVSVLVTTFNHSRFVVEALESVRVQTFRDFEVVITDDASTDGTADVIEAWLARTGFPARYLRNPMNRGICANRNTALSLTSAPFVCSLAGDDAYEPDRLERQVAFFLEQPEHVAAIYSDMRLVDAEGHSFGIYPGRGHTDVPDGKLFSRLIRREFQIPSPATMVRRNAVAAVGGYDESLSYEDMDMWLRLSHAYRFCYVPGAVCRYRVLPTSLSRAARHRPARSASRARIFESWSGRAGRDEAPLMKALAREQIALGRDAEARRSLALAADSSGCARDRLKACLARAPGVCPAVRAVIKLTDRLRPLPIAVMLRRALARYKSARGLSSVR
jgi:glycosyltransferase involved in cell wall biosynthesis